MPNQRSSLVSDPAPSSGTPNAANLGIRTGQPVRIDGGKEPSTITVDGIVDLSAADALFQVVGAPPGSQPSAPPDNVVLLPEGRWHTLFDGTQPASTQVHVARSHALPADPAAAYMQAGGAAR